MSSASPSICQIFSYKLAYFTVVKLKTILLTGATGVKTQCKGRSLSLQRSEMMKDGLILFLPLDVTFLLGFDQMRPFFSVKTFFFFQLMYR